MQPIQNKWRSGVKVVALTLVILLIAIACTYLLFGNVEQTAFLLLLLTLLSVLASLRSEVRELQLAFPMGEYLLLMFCVAIGMLSDFSTLWAEGGAVIGYTGAVLTLTVLLHFGLSYLFKLDRDTTLITSTAALYGPVFVGQIASAINNKSLIFAGIATGLVGYAIGNFLGYGVAQLIRIWLGV